MNHWVNHAVTDLHHQHTENNVQLYIAQWFDQELNIATMRLTCVLKHNEVRLKSPSCPKPKNCGTETVLQDPQSWAKIHQDCW